MIKQFINKCYFTLLFIILFIPNGHSSIFLGTIPFITTWKTDNPGTSNDNQITIPASGGVYNYTVDWGDGTTPTQETAAATHTYVNPGVYQVSITGIFPKINFGFAIGGDRDKLLTIEQWGDNQWETMSSAFEGCSNLQGNFTDAPDLTKANILSAMFKDATMFNSDLNNWDVSSITSMGYMFSGATSFNGDISNWDVSNVTSIINMFEGASVFNRDIGNWDTSSFIYVNGMFNGASSFNKDIGRWSTSNVRAIFGMFLNATSFNQEIGNWDVSNVNTAMSTVFLGATSFNGDIGSWDVSNVPSMFRMFEGASAFNQDIGNWDVSNVTGLGMNFMFNDAASFNQDIGNWNVSNVTGMGSMFEGALSFNQDIGAWDMSNVAQMYRMFKGASVFNQDIADWNTSSSTSFIEMFEDAVTFDQDLSRWDVTNPNTTYPNTGFSDMFKNVTLSTANYDALLIGWNSQDLPANATFNGGNSKYCAGASARANMITSDNWTITDGGITAPTINDLVNQNVSGSFTLPAIIGVDLSGDEKYYTGTNGSGTAFNAGETINFSDFATYPVTLYIYDGGTSGCSTEQDFQLTITKGNLPFITTWKTDNPGTSNNNQITIPTTGGGYNYTVDWGDGTTSTTETGDATHNYAAIGTYTVSITGVFPSIFFNGVGDKEKLLTIEQWGDNHWTSMGSAFNGCSNMQGNFVDSPDLSNVTSLAGMFAGATLFNHNIGNWDVSSVTNMSGMFNGATSFNQNIGNWDLSNTNTTSAMFADASSFNQDIGNWDVSKVINTGSMFTRAISFNQNIGNWNVGNVTNMFGMFTQASSFNEDIGNWDVKNVITMKDMFRVATLFNQDIGNWDVGNVIDMSYMFSQSEFNQDIGNWNVSMVTEMRSMFQNNVNFDQNIGGWVLNNLISANNMFLGARLSTLNYDALLIGWNAQTLNPNVSFHGGNSKYCAGAPDRANMISNDNWSITDDGSVAPSIDDLSDQIVSTDYTLPNITGLNLTGNERYYTGSNATGTIFDIGDVIDFNDFSSYPIVLYIFDSFSSGCSSEQDFELTITSLPECTTLISPIAGAIEVPIETDLEWDSSSGATGYKLTVGTSSGGSDILNSLDVGNMTSYDLLSDLPENTDIHVSVIPYNLDGDAVTCEEESFTTESIIALPECTTLISPIGGVIEVPIETDLEWSSSLGATGYKLTVGTSSGGSDILNGLDVGNMTNYNLSSDLPENTDIYISVIPYNLDGPAVSCSEEFFTTEKIIIVVEDDEMPPKFFTPNNDNINDNWMVSNTSNQISQIFIYNRYGKLLKQVGSISGGWDGTFNGIPMPVGDYWYLINYRNGKNLKGHFSLVR